LAFNVQDKTGPLRNANIAHDEQRERRQTIVLLGIQRDGQEPSGDLDVMPADVTGRVEAASSPADTPVIKPIARRIRHAHRTSRVIVHQRAKHAPTASIFGGRRSSRTRTPEFRFNAN